MFQYIHGILTTRHWQNVQTEGQIGVFDVTGKDEEPWNVLMKDTKGPQLAR